MQQKAYYHIYFSRIFPLPEPIKQSDRFPFPKAPTKQSKHLRLPSDERKSLIKFQFRDQPALLHLQLGVIRRKNLIIIFWWKRKFLLIDPWAFLWSLFLITDLKEDICANLDSFSNGLTCHISANPSPSNMSSHLSDEQDPHAVKYIMRETRASAAFLCYLHCHASSDVSWIKLFSPCCCFYSVKNVKGNNTHDYTSEKIMLSRFEEKEEKREKESSQ